MTSQTTKLYCYVDESGQDARSDFFIVACIVSAEDQQKLRSKLLKLEGETGIGQKKWHKSKSPERETFLARVTEQGIAAGSTCYAHYEKPVEFFLALLETLAGAIKMVAPQSYRCIIYVDGIDEKNAQWLTGAPRTRGIRTAQVRTAHDEGEPLIRLADRWVGCIRASLEGNAKNQKLVEKAARKNHLRRV